ncbi:putative cytochrome P450 monooxygenase [Rhexocercosporidium sp. MPI-PUGE-AT-0058]|nr:putative cytochrome P450 monooxygenase [Rhexocercosporidium sp. MPI-PUGE-AT-0058]
MSLPLILLLCLLTVTYLAYLLSPFLYPPHPRIPNAHRTSGLSSLWLTHLRRGGKTGISAIISAHARHGPIIRLSPSELSVASLEGLKTIYTGGFEKTDFYSQFMNYGTFNLVSLVGNREHTARKRMLSHVYSKSYILSSEQIQEFSRKLVYEDLGPVLRSAVEGGKEEAEGKGGGWGGLDAYALNQAMGADFTSSFLMGMGSCTCFIPDIPAAKDFLQKWKVKSRELPGHAKTTEELEECVLDLLRKGRTASAEDSKGIVRSQLETQLRAKHVKEGEKMSDGYSEDAKIIASEIFDHLIAGIETARITLTYLQWELSLPHNSTIQSALRAELRTLSPPIALSSPSSSRAGTQLPTSREIDTLPLLDAVLKEILRMYPPSPASLPRIVPVGGWCCMGRAAMFCIRIPQCLRHRGSLCRRVLKLITAALYTSFETQIIDDEGIEQEDAFLAGPKGEKLVLGIRAVA